MPPRAQLSLTTDAARAISAADGAVPINATEFAGLVTALVSPSDFDMPVSGRLRYVGSRSGRFSVQATPGLYVEGAGDTNVVLQLGKNGAPIDSSAVQQSLAESVGIQPVAVQAPIDLAPNDYVEVLVASSQAVTLRVVSLPVWAELASFLAETGTITSAELLAFASQWLPSSADVTEDLAFAAALMACFEGTSVSAALLRQIELRLAAHSAALRYPGGRMTRERIEGATDLHVGSTHGQGLRATVYGQSAIALDPTGKLAAQGAARASIEFL